MLYISRAYTVGYFRRPLAGVGDRSFATEQGREMTDQTEVERN